LPARSFASPRITGNDNAFAMVTTTMSTLADTIRQGLTRLTWQQKELALSWAEALGAEKPSTYETKLSKLMNDEDEGYRFLLDGEDGPARLAALARTLELAPELLRQMAEKSRARVTLILHPEVPATSREWLERSAGASDGAFSCVDATDSSPEGIRDLAERYRNTVVVVATDSNRAFFEGARIKTTRVQERNGRPELDGLPGLVPPPEAKLRDDDGMPMLAHAGIELEQRDPPHLGHACNAEALRNSAWQARAEGRPVTYRLDDILTYLGFGVRPEPAALGDSILARVAARLGSEMEKRPEPSFLWWTGERLVALWCPQNELEAFRGKCEITEVTSVDTLIDFLARVIPSLNPYGGRGALDFTSLLDDVRAEIGIAPDLDAAKVREWSARRLGVEGELCDGCTLETEGEGVEEVRSMLDDLLGRPVKLPGRSASVVFQLQAAKVAPMIRLRSAGDSVFALANMGAGRLLWLRFTRYHAEPPTELRCWSGHVRGASGERELFDAGNLLLQLADDFSVGLEGGVARAPIRRREEAETERRRRQEDDDDDE
jgi:hypothetical protein